MRKLIGMLLLAGQTATRPTEKQESHQMSGRYMTLEGQEITRWQSVNCSVNLPRAGTFFLVFPSVTLERCEKQLGPFKNYAVAADKPL